MDEQSPFSEGVAELSTFLVGDRSLQDTLTRVAALAVAAVPPAKFAGVTMMVDGKVTTQAFTDTTAPDIDQAQYRTGRGPCLQAFLDGTVISVPSLQGDERWPEFAAVAMDQGVRSTLSLPMLPGDASLGALNLYADSEHAFGGANIETALLFAAQAGTVLANAQAYWGARLSSEHLQQALAGREVIDLAKGIIISAVGCGPDQAFRTLVAQSQQQNRKLRDVAADIVARAQRS